jgi:hypothetical protein
MYVENTKELIKLGFILPKGGGVSKNSTVYKSIEPGRTYGETFIGDNKVQDVRHTLHQ